MAVCQKDVKKKETKAALYAEMMRCGTVHDK
jgi:hypothetical protein